MKRRLPVFILFFIILAMAGGLLYWWGTPALLEVSPTAGAIDVPAGAPLRLTFSRPLQAASLEGRLTTDPPMTGQISVEGSALVFTPDRPWPSGQVVQVRLAPGARAAGWLPLPQRQIASWSFTTGHPQLVYLYPSTGLANLYVHNPQTGETQALTEVDGEVLDFTIAANGTRLYYSVGRGDGGSALYLLDRLSGASTKVLDCPQALCRSPHISPKGDTLAYERTELSTAPQSARPEVRLLDLPSGDTRPAGEAGHSTEGPLWSATGLLSFYDVDLRAFVFRDLQTGESGNIPNQTGLGGDWDPAGQDFIMADIFLNPVSTASDPSVEQMQSSRLLIYHRGSKRSDDLSGADDLEDTNPVFSPDGAWVAFSRKYLDLTRWTPGRQLWVMDSGGASPQSLTQDAQYNHYDIAWSPTGQQLAYVRFNQTLMTEPPEVWVISLDGARAVRQVAGGLFTPMAAVIACGQTAPGWTLPDLEGCPVSLSDFRARLLVMNFWSAECIWSRRADEELSLLRKEWSEKVAFVTIACNANEGPVLIRSAARERGLPQVLFDPPHAAAGMASAVADLAGSVADRYGAAATPHLFVIDELGILRYQGALDDATFRRRLPTRLYLRQAVEALLDGRLPDPVETPAYGCALVRYTP